MWFKKLRRGLFGSFRFRQWIDYDHLVENFKFIQSACRFLKKQPVGEKNLYTGESFEACMQRLGVSEVDLQQRMRTAKAFTAFYALVGLCALGYAIYMETRRLWLAGLMVFLLAMLFLGYAFRENFNYFQMKQRRLGCTYQEWLAWIRRRGK